MKKEIKENWEKSEDNPKNWEQWELELGDILLEIGVKVNFEEGKTLRDFIRHQIAEAVEEYANEVIPKMTEKWRGYVKEAEKRGIELETLLRGVRRTLQTPEAMDIKEHAWNIMNEIEIHRGDKNLDKLLNIKTGCKNKIRQEARKEIVSEVEKWAKENKVYDFVKLETLLSKLKEL